MKDLLKWLVLVMVLGLLVATAAAQDSNSASVTRITLDDSVYILVGISAFVGFAVGAVIGGLRRGEKPQAIDASVVARLELMQSNRDHMERYERLYQQSNTVFKSAFDSVVTIVGQVSQWTPQLKVDDAAYAFLRDMQKAGPPEGGSAPLAPARGQPPVDAGAAIAQ